MVWERVSVITREEGRGEGREADEETVFLFSVPDGGKAPL